MRCPADLADRRGGNAGDGALGGLIRLAVGRDLGQSPATWLPVRPPYGKSWLDVGEGGGASATKGVPVSGGYLKVRSDESLMCFYNYNSYTYHTCVHRQRSANKDDDHQGDPDI